LDSLLLTRLAELSSAEKLPEHDYFFSLADAAVSVLEKEICGFRKKGRNGKAGGLLDFSDERSLPLILVPDLHARAYFLQNIMNFVRSMNKDDEQGSVFDKYDFLENPMLYTKDQQLKGNIMFIV